jgi:hypothetical protein
MAASYIHEMLMKFRPLANVTKLFWHNCYCFSHIALSLDSGYATGGVYYGEKSFVKWTPGNNVIKLFTTVSYAFSK